MNTYVRPRRTFSTVELDGEALGQGDTVKMRRPVQTERLKRLPGTILPAVLPSSRRLTTKFLPRFGSLETIRRPVDRAAAVPIDRAYIRARIRTNLHVEKYFDFIFYITLGTGFWTPGFLLIDWRAGERPRRPAILPLLPGGQPRPRWAEKNEIRIPHRSIYIGPSRLDFHERLNAQPVEPVERRQFQSRLHKEKQESEKVW